MRDACCREMVLAAGFDVVRSGAGTEGMFDYYCREELGKPGVTIEMPPLRRVDARFSAIGFRGVLNVMRHIGMLDSALELPPRTLIFVAGEGKSLCVKAEREGYMARLAESGQEVKDGDLVAEIWSPDTFKPVQTIRAPFDSFVTSIGRVPHLWGEPEQDFINIGKHAVLFSTPDEIVDPAKELGLRIIQRRQGEHKISATKFKKRR